MSDDLFEGCDCGDCDCGDCDCGDGDCHWFDSDCFCDDCLPGNNVILIWGCCMPSSNNTNDGNRIYTPPGCCCCCENRDNKPRRRKKKGCCCCRIWCCCFLCEDPKPPCSPPSRRPGRDDLSRRGYIRDGKRPMHEDPDLCMHSKWSRHHEDDMPPMPPGEMCRYRDEYYGRGGRWNPSSKESYYKGDRWDERYLRRKGCKDYKRDEMRKLGREDIGPQSRRVPVNTRGAPPRGDGHLSYYKVGEVPSHRPPAVGDPGPSRCSGIIKSRSSCNGTSTHKRRRCNTKASPTFAPTAQIRAIPHDPTPPGPGPVVTPTHPASACSSAPDLCRHVASACSSTGQCRSP